MTSKEGFNLLQNFIIYKAKEYQQNCEFRNLQTNEKIECKTLIELIQKDLEMLEILRKYYKKYGWSNEGVIEFWAMPEAQLKKVKEWLNG